MEKTILYAFDFDYTIVNVNSDTQIAKLLPNPLPKEIKEFYDGSNWTEYVNKVLEYLYASGVTIEKIEEFVSNLPPSPGMIDLLYKIKKRKEKKDGIHQLLVISDANDIFISSFMTFIGVHPDFVITNRAFKTPEGKIVLEPYENQDNCDICPRNLCKGKALAEQMEKVQNYYTSIAYIGDGRNDLCPALKLRQSDFLFVRKGYSLEKLLTIGKVQGRKDANVSYDFEIKAQIHYWDNADTINKILFFNED